MTPSLVNPDDPLALQRRAPGLLPTAGASPAPAAASSLLPRAGTSGGELVGKQPTNAMSGASELLPGLRQIGNTNLANRPVLRNPDGSRSTESSASFGTDKGETLLPTVINGKRLTNDQALNAYQQSGKHMGIFDTPENADNYASGLEAVHEKEAAAGKYGTELPRAGSAGTSSPARTSAMPTAGSQPSPAQTELTRLQTTGPGYSQVKNPFLRGLATVGNVAASMFPKAAPFIPGTDQHHGMLLAGAGRAVAGEQAGKENEARTQLQEAQAEEQKSLPDLHKTQTELAGEKLAHKNENDQANIKLKQAEEDRKTAEDKAKIVQHLRDTGYDEDGNPLTRDQMPPAQQAQYDLRVSHKELTDAQKDFEAAKTKNLPIQMDLAQKRIENAKRNRDLAVDRLELSKEQFEMRAHGTEGGQALPGAMLDDNDHPIGTAFQQNVRPTGQERNKADLAGSAHDQIADLKGIVAKRADIFGPAAGRKTDFTVWLGSQDPDAQRFRAARTIAGDHLAGVFGGRSETALKALDDAIGQFKDNPAALQAGLDQLDKANTRFLQKGTVKTSGSKADTGEPQRPAGVPADAKWNADKRQWEK